MQPTSRSATLPILYLGNPGLELEDGEVEWLEDILRWYPPTTKLVPGDLVRYTPAFSRFRSTATPQIMEVRFVISLGQHLLHDFIQQDFKNDLLQREVYGVWEWLGQPWVRDLGPEELGWWYREHLKRLRNCGRAGNAEVIEQWVTNYLRGNITRLRTPLVYAHRFPHGTNPDSADWIYERYVKKIGIRNPVVPCWEEILDAFKVPFMGYDERYIRGPLVLDMAPDSYGCGNENSDRPLLHEEPTLHTLCCMGFERLVV